MPENKRQHYVPKHALKRFAADQDGKQINLVHISSRKVIRGASLREQCYRDYFYGSNLDIERTLSLMESSQSKLIEKIIAAEKLDPFDAGAITLIFALQRSRTLRAETEMSEMVESLMKTVMYGRFEETTLRNVRIGLEHGAGLNIQTALLMAPLLHDLRQVLIVNRTSVPFVLSDSPVVTTNWFCRYRHPERHSTGISMSGLQMLLPITPSLAILLLDRGVYSTEAIGDKVSLQKPADVHHLNSLQWLGALKTVYFPATLPEASVDALLQIKRPDTGLFRYERLERVGESNAFRKTEKDEYDGPSPGVTSELTGEQIAENLWHCPGCGASPLDIFDTAFWSEDGGGSFLPLQTKGEVGSDTPNVRIVDGRPKLDLTAERIVLLIRSALIDDASNVSEKLGALRAEIGVDGEDVWVALDIDLWPEDKQPLQALAVAELLGLEVDLIASSSDLPFAWPDLGQVASSTSEYTSMMLGTFRQKSQRPDNPRGSGYRQRTVTLALLPYVTVRSAPRVAYCSRP